ncbi:MAG: hypothetical protein HDR50_02430 [Desulfovibrio sp.]|uniref:hypothetical protein n=1 Tax=Desulfovibrio sp. TaxID=885 RepID=UPI001A70E2A0|nr:hypothetical protein [Desulfovibrio sp.]MBD5416532.1 hypothetical protein [Desulfovibrio sp.]
MTDRTSNLLAKVEAGADAPGSFGVFPVPQSGMSRLGAFALGVLTGVIGVAVAATILEEMKYEGEADDNEEDDWKMTNGMKAN